MSSAPAAGRLRPEAYAMRVPVPPARSSRYGAPIPAHACSCIGWTVAMAVARLTYGCARRRPGRGLSPGGSRSTGAPSARPPKPHFKPGGSPKVELFNLTQNLPILGTQL